MNSQKLAETVLYQIEHFWLLQEIDEAVLENDSATVSALDKIYSHRSVRWQNLIPFVRLNTVLSSLFVPLSFAARFSDDELAEYGFKVKAEYCTCLTCRGSVVPATAQVLLRTLRNAVAHLSDYAAGKKKEEPNIAFDSGILRCRSNHYELVFESEAGFVLFLSELLQATKVAAGKFIGGE